MFVYSSYFKLAHVGSLDHYVSFLRAPTTAKGPFWLCLYLDISPRTWLPRVYFTQSIYLYTAGLLFCIGLKRPFRPCFLWRGLLLFFKGSGGPVLRTSTFSETSFSKPRWLGCSLFRIFWQFPWDLCPKDTERSSSFFSLLLCESIWESCLDSWCYWLSRLGGSPIFGLWACFWVCLCDMALISEAISHKLAQKGVIFYLLNYLGHQVNPWADALASVVEQDWWLVFAFHHIRLCKSSYLCIKLVTWNLCLDFSGWVEHVDCLPNQIGHGKDV